MSKFYIFVAIMIAIGVGLKLFGGSYLEKEEKKKSLYKYKRKDFLISRPEHEFFNILVEILFAFTIPNTVTVSFM